MVAFAAQYLPDPKYLMKNMLIENLYRISIKKYDCTDHNHSVTKFTELSHLRLFCTLEIEERYSCSRREARRSWTFFVYLSIKIL